MKKLKFLSVAALMLIAAFISAPTMAEESGTTHIVEMLNKGEEGNMIFKPAVLYVNVGDTVHFKPTNPGHNAQSFKDMTPEGGTTFRTKMNKPADVVIDAQGVWAYNCMPHKSMGMVGLIIAGDADIAEFEPKGRLSPLTKKRFELYLADPVKYSNKAEVKAEAEIDAE